MYRSDDHVDMSGCIVEADFNQTVVIDQADFFIQICISEKKLAGPEGR
jgi:hypothetical protein